MMENMIGCSKENDGKYKMTISRSLKLFVERIEKRAVNIRKMLEQRKVLFGEPFDESDPCELVTMSEIFGSESGDILTYGQNFLVMYRYDENTSAEGIENMWSDLKVISRKLKDDHLDTCIECNQRLVYRAKDTVFTKCFVCIRKESLNSKSINGICKICNTYPKIRTPRTTSSQCVYCKTEDARFRREQKSINICVDCLKNEMMSDSLRCIDCVEAFNNRRYNRRVVKGNGKTSQELVTLCPMCQLRDKSMNKKGTKMRGYCRPCYNLYQRSRNKYPKIRLVKETCPRCKVNTKAVTDSGYLLTYCRDCHNSVCREANIRKREREKKITKS